MKNYLIYALILFLLLNCSDNENAHLSENRDDSVEDLLTRSQDNNVSHNKRLYYCNKALSAILKEKNDSITRSKIFIVVENLYSLNNNNNLKFAIRQLLLRSDAKKDSYHIAQAYRYLGLINEGMSKNDSAFYYYSKAQKIFIKLNKSQEVCVTYQDKALVQYFINNFSDSELSLIKALRIANRLKLDNEAYRIYISLGLNAREQSDFEGALSYFNRAMDVLKAKKVNFHSFHKEYCLNNMGYIYLLKGEFETSQNLFLEALRNEKIKLDPIIFSRLQDNYCKVSIELGAFSNVERSLYTTHAYRSQLNILEGQNFNRLYLSQYYTAINDTAKAKYYANEAYDLSKSFKAPNDMLMCLKHLTKIDPKNALEYSSRYIKISDSMHQLERETRNKFAKIAYETEEITQEKELAEKQKSIWAGTTITVTGFGMLLFVIARQRIRQKELLIVQTQQEAKEEIYQLMHNQQSKIDEGREIEKKRIARDLHDGIMNRLASTRFNLHVLNTKTDEQTIQNCLSYIDNIHEIEKEIRNISHDLNKDVFSENDSFKRILFAFFDEQKNILSAKLHVDIDKAVKWELLKSSQKINLYRILQEAFQNATKHARAENIFVSIANQGNYILLEIHDDGIGFSVNGQKKGIGLQNLRARAKDCEGIFHINSNSGKGTTIIISIPINNENLS